VSSARFSQTRWAELSGGKRLTTGSGAGQPAVKEKTKIYDHRLAITKMKLRTMATKKEVVSRGKGNRKSDSGHKRDGIICVT